MLAILAVVVIVVTGAAARVSRRVAGPEPRRSTTAEIAELEAAREAKYREIRDAELDHRTGKLSDADFEALDTDAARRGDRDPARAGSRARRLTGRYHLAPMTTILGVLQVFICVVLIFLILMHSGKDAGLSGAFGVGTGAGPFGGGSLVERNLNRWTIGFAIVFVINTIVLIKIS